MTSISCACRRVKLVADKAPVISVICHCASCRTAGQALDAASGTVPIVDEWGGTSAVLWRKDRIRCVAGGELLVEHRLMPTSPTRRMVASCCATPMFLDFTKGFWLSVYRGRAADAPPPSMRTMTGDMPPGIELPDDGLTRATGISGRFMAKLLITWVAMGFRLPSIEGVRDR